MNNSIIEIYQVESGKTEITVRLDNETVWLSLNQLTELFQKDKSVISRHISNIFKEKELERDSVVAKNATLGIAHGVFLGWVSRSLRAGDSVWRQNHPFSPLATPPTVR